MNATLLKLGQALLLVLAMAAALKFSDSHAQMKVQGRFLYDHLGNQIILRGMEEDFGVNKTGSYIDEIAKTGANAVRIAFNVNSPLTPTELDNMIQRAIAHKMVVFITPGWYQNDLQQPAYFLAQPEIKEVLMRYQNYIIIEVIGEPEWFGDFDRWALECKESITIARNAGYTCPLNLFPTGYGRDVECLINKGAEVLNFDPLKNVLFQLQAYYDDNSNGTQTSTYYVTDAIQRCVASGLPIQIGVVAFAAGGSVVDYKTQMSEAHKYNMNYMVWAWYNPYEWNQYFNISTNGNFGSWTSQTHKYGNDFGYQITMGHAASINKTAQVLPVFQTPTSTGGLKGEYFNNKTLTAPVVLTRTDPGVNFTWTASPGAGVTADNFSVRWSGQVEAPVTGAYTFATTSDDGVRLSVNGVQIINNWTDHSTTTNTAAAVNLTAGQRYTVVMEFYESGYDAVARLLWAYPGQLQQVIPSSRLFPTATTVPDPGTFSGNYKITARHSGKSLDVLNASIADGANIQQLTYSGIASQQWKLEAIADGYYKITNVNSGKSLDVAEFSTADGGKIHQWTYFGTTNQQWKIEATSDGYYRILSRGSGKALDVTAVSTADGAGIQQWTYGGGTNQQWKLEKLSSNASARINTSETPRVVSEENESTVVSVYPNPSKTGYLEVNFNAPDAGQVVLFLTNANGQRQGQTSYAVVKGENALRYSTAEFTEGFYILTLQQGRFKSVRKVMINK